MGEEIIYINILSQKKIEKRPNQVRHMRKQQKTEKMCMQVMNEHHREQDVWSWRKLNQ